MNSDQRSEKETLETNTGKETDMTETRALREKCQAISFYYDQAIDFLKEKKKVNFYQLERYMHRFIQVRGKRTLQTGNKSIAAWTGMSEEFTQVILALQTDHLHVCIATCQGSDYSEKGRKPNLPIATGTIEYDEMHWQPMMITYKEEHSS